MSIHLRPYQEQALAAEAQHRIDHPDETRLAIVMATGLGKTIVMAERARRFLDSFDGAGNRVLILVHTDELAQQAEAKVRLVAQPPIGPDEGHGLPWSVGVVKAERDETDADIIIGSVQTLADPKRRARITDVGLVIVDECHHATAASYQAIMEHFGCMPDCDHRAMGRDLDSLGGHCTDCYDTGFTGPPTPALGFTATLERGDGQGLGEVWHNVCFTRDISWGVRHGYLVQPVGHRLEIAGLDLYPGGLTGGDVSRIAGDAALVDALAPERIVEKWIELAIDLCEMCRDAIDVLPDDAAPAIPTWCDNVDCAVNDKARMRPTVAFMPLVRSARVLALAFNDAGIKAHVIHGDMPKWERTENLAAYERGDLQVLVNAMVLTEGWDSPRTKCVIVGRPTKSRSLFCLDDRTEILTDQGWRGMGDNLTDARPAAFDLADGSIRWSPLLGRVERPLGADEGMFALSSPTADIRVSDRHRMVWMGRRQSAWKVSEAREVAALRSDYRIPIAGDQKASGVPLTDDEIRFIGWFMTDGTLGNNGAITITQAEHQPWNADIVSCLRGCGFKYGVYSSSPETSFRRTSPLMRYTISRGAPRGTDKHLRGWGALEPYISKQFAPALDDMTRDQLAVLLRAMHLGNGAKSGRHSYHISTSDKAMADRLQSLCIRRGFKCNIATGDWNAEPIYILHIKDVTWKSVGGSSQANREQLRPSPGVIGERVWCVETDAGTIVTRRNGKVAILGNCQMAGRGLRPVPGIPVEDQDCILLCVADSTTDLCSVADLSDRPLPRTLQGALTAMEDQWDIGKALDEQEQAKLWTGRVDAKEFDPLVQRSSKVWRTTKHGTPFLPISKRQEYVFIVGTSVFVKEFWNDDGSPRSLSRVKRLHKDLPDLELAMSVAEDEAQERGGDVGRLLADRNRAWRKQVPSADMQELAIGLGLGKELDAIMSSRAGGKAGKTSDLISRVQATRALEPMVERIKGVTT